MSEKSEKIIGVGLFSIATILGGIGVVTLLGDSEAPVVTNKLCNSLLFQSTQSAELAAGGNIYITHTTEGLYGSTDFGITNDSSGWLVKIVLNTAILEPTNNNC